MCYFSTVQNSFPFHIMRFPSSNFVLCVHFGYELSVSNVSILFVLEREALLSHEHMVVLLACKDTCSSNLHSLIK